MGAPRNPGRKQRRKRTVRDLAVYQRSAALANLRRAAEAAAPPNFAPASIFSPWALWAWTKRYLPQVLEGKHSFPTDAGPGKALYHLRGEADGSGSGGPGNVRTASVRVGLAGDWGTGTAEAQSVAERMQAFQPHFTIHLGDVYPVGDARSVNENCLGIRNPENNYDPVHWPMGSQGSFALNGNHEMFANGSGYFDVFLPTLGMMGADRRRSGQPTSFFCLQNEDWRIIALDTGYNSAGVPILSNIPLVNGIPGICGDCRLEQSVVDWIKNVVEPDQCQRGLILLSTIRTIPRLKAPTEDSQTNCGRLVSGGQCFGFGGMSTVWRGTICAGRVSSRVMGDASGTEECRSSGDVRSMVLRRRFTTFAALQMVMESTDSSI